MKVRRKKRPAPPSRTEKLLGKLATVQREHAAAGANDPTRCAGALPGGRRCYFDAVPGSDRCAGHRGEVFDREALGAYQRATC